MPAAGLIRFTRYYAEQFLQALPADAALCPRLTTPTLSGPFSDDLPLLVCLSFIGDLLLGGGLAVVHEEDAEDEDAGEHRESAGVVRVTRSVNSIQCLHQRPEKKKKKKKKTKKRRS